MRNKSNFIEIYDTYWHQLYSYAYNIIRSKQLAEDVIQEVFLDLWNRFDEAHIQNHKAYLFKAVKFQSIKQLKGIKFNEVQLEKIEYALELLESSEETLMNLNKRLLKQIDEKSEEFLPEKCLQIFKLRYKEDLSYKEISKKLQISISTVDNQLNKAHRILKNLNIYDAELLMVLLFLQCLS